MFAMRAGGLSLCQKNPNNMRKLRLFLLVALSIVALSAQGFSETATVEGDHGMLSVRIDRPEPKSCTMPLFVLCHGFGANKGGALFDAITDSLNRVGIAVLRFDFNGHGQSEGRFEDMTVPNEIQDALCVLRYASSLPWVSGLAIGGHSQGGVVASMVAGQLALRRNPKIKQLRALVLLAPAAVLRDDALRGNTFGKVYNPKNPPEKIEMWDGRCLGGDYVRTAVGLPIYETAKNYQSVECVVHGEADRVVPYTYGQRFHYLNPKSEWNLLPNADHGFTGQETRVADVVSRFLAKILM